MRKKKLEERSFHLNVESSKKDHMIRYRCNKLGHMIVDCLQGKKNSMKFKKKTILATWSDIDENNSCEEEENKVTSLCLMVMNEDKNEIHSHLDYSCDNLQDAFKELYNESIKHV